MAPGRFRPGLTLPTVAGVILAVAAVRLVFAGLIPLTEDEAYYRLWSMRLQPGYFDHPPMIAWWIAAGRGLVGDTALGARLLPVLANAVAAFLLIDAVRTLGVGERPALRAGLWLNATLLIGAGGLLAIPDAPTLLFWTATLWALARATRTGADSSAVLRWWALAGVAAGLAVLSKYSALFLAPGLLLWLCLTTVNRRRLSTPGPWLAAVAALGVVAPHIAWNAANGWVSVIKQFGRVGAQSFEPVHLVALISGQFLLLNPIIAVFAALAVFRADALKSPEALLWLSSTPFLVYLAAHSLHDPVQAHWPAPAYPAVVGLAAIAAERVSQNRSGLFWRQAAPFVGMGLVSVILTFAAAPALDAVAGPATRPLRGWPEFGATVQTRAAMAGEVPAAWIGTMSYGLAAQLAAEPGLTLPVVQLNDRARYDPLPPVAVPEFDRPGLVIDLPRRITVEALRSCFAAVEALEPIRRDVGKGATEVPVVYAAFRVSRPIRIVSGGCWRGRDMPPEPSSGERRPGDRASPSRMDGGLISWGRVADPAPEAMEAAS
ncbi:MAG: glycosyltransferase family 39 protein [Alphaproteobacteria bacterium]|nr:glycosyltransferase family 39 protein [Alphaproteobacteria bacterium]MBU2269831.1 glycosyltransferase family 39 protein [Alphaproteobacteria bacterium]MBU2419969.1 glycosyltransferase family 39 protein [Alphaproteobacteria bacterium]